MPAFLFGQTPFPPNVGPSPFDRDVMEAARIRAAAENQIADVVVPFVLNEGFSKGWEEGLAIIKHGAFFPAEVGSLIIEPTPVGQGEEAAIALQQERERQAREAMTQMDRPKPIKVEQTDP